MKSSQIWHKICWGGIKRGSFFHSHSLKKFSILIVLLLASFSLSAQTIQNGVLTFPEGTTEIKSKAYYGNTDVEKVIIPSTVTKIGNLAFHKCGKLEEIDIPGSVKAIGDAAFQNCTRLSKVTLHEGLTKMGAKLFTNTAITEITIPKSVVEFGNDIFSSCENLTAIKVDKYSEAHTQFSSNAKMVLTGNPPVRTREQWLATAKKAVVDDGVVKFPEGTTEIKSNAFYGNTAVKKVIVPNTVTKIGNLAFHKCGKLEEIDIPGSVKAIGDAAFQNCTRLSKVTLYNGLTTVKFRAFKNTAIEEITVPSSVTEVGSEVFSDCKKLKTIKVDKYSETHSLLCRYTALTFTDKKPNITEKQFLDKYNDKRDIVLDKVLYIKTDKTAIGNHAYYGNKTFTKVVIPSSVTSIGGCAFYETKLESVRVPGNVKKVDHEAFRFTPAKEIIFEEGVEEIGSMACYTNIGNAVIKIPDSVKKMPKTGAYAGISSPSQKWIVVQGSYAHEYHHGRCPLQIDYSQPYSAYSGDKALNVTIEENIPSDYFKHCPNLKSVDVGPKITNILPGTFPKNVTLRVKRNTYADKWAKENGYYLCGALADLSSYTKDKSKEIKEDFTRILTDNDSYWNIINYKFQVNRPLKVECVGKDLVLTSFMMYPCKNVTIYRIEEDGTKTKFKSFKCVQPLSRTVLGERDEEKYEVLADDDLYKKIYAMKATAQIAFCRFTETCKFEMGWGLKTKPVFCRYWIELITNMFYTMSSKEFEDMMHDYVANKRLYTDKAKTQFITKEYADNLLARCLKKNLVLGACSVNALGGGNLIYVEQGWLDLVQTTNTMTYYGAYHEFMHCMDYGHHHGNMCNGEVDKYDWCGIGSQNYKKFFIDKTLPYSDPNNHKGHFFSPDAYIKFIGGAEKGYPAPRDDDPKPNTVSKGLLTVGDNAWVIGKNYYQNHKILTQATFPSSLNIINAGAFCSSSIEELNLPPTVKEVGNEAFKNAKNLRKITIADGVEKIDYAAFSNTPITSIDIPGSVVTIGESAFSDCTDLKNVKMQYGVRYINSYAFVKTALTSIDIPDSVFTIGSNAFRNLALTNVKIGNKVKRIEEGAFYNTRIGSVTLPASLRELGHLAFHSCFLLREINIPGKVTLKGSAHFQNCTSMQKITIGDGINHLSFRMFKNTAVKEVTIPASVRLIKNEAFSDCKSLAKVTFAEGVTEIGDSAFQNTALTEVVLPKTVTKIGSNAFHKSRGTLILTVPDSVTEFGKNCTAKNAVWIVKKGSKAYEYAAANGCGIMLSGGDFSVKIPAEYKDLPADKWSRNTFAKDTTYYHWDFSDKLQGSGTYNIKFTYKYGAEKLVLKDAMIIADGKVITRYIGEVSAGHSPRQIVYTVLLPNGAKKLELIAANTRNASTDTNGVIELVKETFEQEDIAKIGAKIIAESQNAASASITGWGKDDFTSSDTQRKWDFTSSIKGSGDYIFTFTYTDGANMLCLTDTLFAADGKPVAYYKDTRTAGNDPKQIVFEVSVPEGTKTLEMYSLARYDGGTDSVGEISVTGDALLTADSQNDADLPDQDEADDEAEQIDLPDEGDMIGSKDEDESDDEDGFGNEDDTEE